MGKMVLDAATGARLRGLNEVLELHDEAGAVIGYCLPPDMYRDMVAIPAEAGFSDAEVAAVMTDTDPGRPLVDILADLRRQHP